MRKLLLLAAIPVAGALIFGSAASYGAGPAHLVGDEMASPSPSPSDSPSPSPSPSDSATPSPTPRPSDEPEPTPTPPPTLTPAAAPSPEAEEPEEEGDNDSKDVAQNQVGVTRITAAGRPDHESTTGAQHEQGGDREGRGRG